MLYLVGPGALWSVFIFGGNKLLLVPGVREIALTPEIEQQTTDSRNKSWAL